MKIVKFLFFFIIIICISTLYPTGLLDIYKKGVIKIEPDLKFGKEVDWGSLFFDSNKDLIVTTNGDIFVCNNRTHNYYKFDSQGKLLGTFGRKGQGPGDLLSPKLKTLLDEKYLVFNEDAAIRKISVFNFSGKCITTLRTEMNCFGAIGLKKGYISYYSIKNDPEIKNGKSKAEITIHIVNIKTKNTIKFHFGTINKAYIKALGNSVITMAQSLLGDFILNRMGDGNILAGITNSPNISIFSTEGKLIKKFQLNITPIPVTRQYIENHKQLTINDTLKNQTNKELKKIIRNALENSDFGNLFGEYLPYYKTIILDSEGNILVFKWQNSSQKTTTETFQVYSPDGKYICETLLDKGKFDIDVYRNFQTMQFSGKALYAIVKNKENEDFIRLIKVKL